MLMGYDNINQFDEVPSAVLGLVVFAIAISLIVLLDLLCDSRRFNDYRNPDFGIDP